MNGTLDRVLKSWTATSRPESETINECSSAEEAMERLRKGQHILIREGTAARNLESLLPLFDEPFAGPLPAGDGRPPSGGPCGTGAYRRHYPQSCGGGKGSGDGIRMATIQAAEYFGLRRVGAVAPGYRADLLVLDDLESVAVRDVYHAGKKVVSKGRVLPFAQPGDRSGASKGS